MSRLDDLIRELCPDGVPFEPLASIAEYSRARVPADEIQAGSFTGVDNLLPDRGGRILSKYPPKSGNAVAYGEGDVLIGNIRPYLKKIWLADGPGGASADVLVVVTKQAARESLRPDFLYHVLASDAFFAFNSRHSKGAAMPRGDRKAILEFKVPIPPVAVQAEIVRVLSLFQSLEAELEAELEARIHQYAHYRDSLFRALSNARAVAFGDVATIARGASPRPIRNYLTESADGIPWIKIGDVPATGKYVTATAERVTINGASKSRRVKSGDFILSNSMSFGRPYIVRIDGCIHDGWLSISEFENSFDANYLYHLLRSAPVQGEFRRRAGSGGAVSNLNSAVVRGIALPMPEMSVQIRIADTLDKFDALVNDLSVGLPAELAARRQQYEHYRDRLLTFDELPA
ncbi:restriction endonuclease subunit S [Schumannella sp. 10F1B-5-1]|uniref:restriction endonuclease subunit S n=1 Tax=Schumannella sp. 10F1B-5-1 TaxID=2590780 RepID=UPI00113166EB|nr:restriction endonuclease subunit S [Schumannella sp. 10F1B-5-1]TPW76992.1 restriction endonuclease subunit S [Schumannella sp. 10F1B-5-1]